jgi:CelD/BcsL family acetyltransferase involved in cellulose biosynthesis
MTDQASEQRSDTGKILISCYENDVPFFLEAELEQLYGSMYSSLAQFRIYSADKDTSTYIVRQDGKAITIFLFQRENNRVQVVNEVIEVSEEEVDRFAAYVFNTFPWAGLITFKAVRTDIRRLRYPFQRFNYLEDIVLSLPDSAEEYLAMLGKNTRRNIKRYTKRLQEKFPSVEYGVCVQDEIDAETIFDIADLNRARMADKSKVSSIDREEAERIYRLARDCGLVGVIKIDGRICAGGISYRIGSNYFLSVIAHDPRYDDYWLGILCCYLTICECIARGGKEFHFLWGRYDYKFTLLGVKRDLDNLAIYRSRTGLLLNMGVAFKIAFKGYLRLATLWLQDAKHRNNFASRLAIVTMNRVRGWRRVRKSVAVERK